MQTLNQIREGGSKEKRKKRRRKKRQGRASSVFKIMEKGIVLHTWKIIFTPGGEKKKKGRGGQGAPNWMLEREHVPGIVI